ncbi:hypothetical protein QFC21_007150 [Naganishia friedmannii]|uniref:Uncharacterized protein n=1 Tax=Naganishia friedmannii TaxID=89922 RepID=A0ACC2UXI1_9TREE|nr:hypothetical protein QFC21_007150 [Naganishia friedmannii]
MSSFSGSDTTNAGAETARIGSLPTNFATTRRPGTSAGSGLSGQGTSATEAELIGPDSTQILSPSASSQGADFATVEFRVYDPSGKPSVVLLDATTLQILTEEADLKTLLSTQKSAEIWVTSTQDQKTLQTAFPSATVNVTSDAALSAAIAAATSASVLVSNNATKKSSDHTNLAQTIVIPGAIIAVTVIESPSPRGET